MLMRKWRLWKGWMRYLAWRQSLNWKRIPIGRRFAFMMFLVILVVLTPYQWITYHHLQNTLLHHQRVSLQERLQTALVLLEKDAQQLLRTCEDYAYWGEARQAVQKLDLHWLSLNILERIPNYYGSDAVAILDTRGTPVGTSGEGSVLIPSAQFLLKQALQGTSTWGFVRLKEKIYQVACVPFVGEELLPSTGVLMVAKQLSPSYQRLIWGTLSEGIVLSVDAVRSPQQVQGELRVDYPTPSAVRITVPLYDSQGTPIAYLQATTPPAQSHHIQQVLWHAKLFLLATSLVITTLVTWVMLHFLRRQVGRFLYAVNLLANGNWLVRVPYPANDEFGQLARAFNKMADQLQTAFETQLSHQQESERQRQELETLYHQLQQANRELERLNQELLEHNALLSQAAMTDALTGLKNHRAFHEALISSVQMAERFHQPLTLIMLDVDHFKQFNDQFGHPAGDEVLRTVGAVLRQFSRAYDVPARYGGEEFAIILPNTGLQEAVQIAERLRRQIESIETPHRRITASFGVAVYRHGTMPATLLYEADSALYQAKQQGRNCVCVYQPPLEDSA